MILLSVNEIVKYFGPEPVLDGVTFDISTGDKIGLVGPNGAGKTTLLRILTGHLEGDSGQVLIPDAVRIGFLEQQIQFSDQLTTWDVAAEGLRPLMELTQQTEQLAAELAAADCPTKQTKLARRFDQLQHQAQQADAYNLDHRIERVLAGLGFADHQFQQPANQLSGGQQNRLLLAQLLLSEPDVMLLDEPSNHLDLPATQWLESFLADSRQACLIVSHDRYFLDKTTNRTLELFHCTVDEYRGNFSAYRRQQAERVEVQRRTYERQRAEIARLEDFVRRHHVGQKHAQAEDRRKKLERIERVPPPREIKSPPMRFATAKRSGDIVLRVEGLSKSFQQPLFQQLTFDVLRGERWGILGGNGTGKTTLLRCVLGLEPADEGTAVLGQGVQTGFFDQQLRTIRDDLRMVDAVRPDGRELDEPRRRDLLARFGLTGDMVFERVGTLSGGERNRTALARLAANEANFLVLDEPTNHLDLWARDALEQAIKRFNGTVMLVSHDRYFLNRVVDHLIVVESGRFRLIDGNYDTYVTLLAAGLAGPGNSAEKDGKVNRERRDEKPPRRRRKFPYRKVADIEAEIAQHESEVEQLHQQLTQPDVLRNGDSVKQIKARTEELNAAIGVLYEHWEEAAELNG